MQEFLKALNEKKGQIYEEEYGNVSASTEVFFATMRKKFKKLEGMKAQYKDKNTRCNAVVLVKKAYPYYVLVERTYYGSGVPHSSCMAVSYGSLFCKEAVLREERLISEQE